ncbi:hypothetical protein [Aneurinibacillus aneurinilyticus]|jgi:DNA-directed RNA polymerase subunit M/transcription elongation factor TFIIS|uniref:LITAF domain-containing protein n=2 Tax=Aneurinibacillus aneurinilyticus TaxID=1391 RepID=A0A848CVZ6_ANEAE|nr:hypothetical protein [Aneurinibacillus aneurinilyticus]ERI11789.1 hypothetical protein HMPREF0083_00117 [Aneurinibacillus aneurinilyticus ATCC 12856]MCI1694907.1 hypothetical protein [Aneurinibacillus aneurinilyticus]MED0706591.1 hypothetical protein [Aneurinibacillus aneurinilyticus]MED0725592.1 hypothetical protein [Aneurinibacillus aneurinilyticus]MED0734767.1 hypothetical protein [Aneurinibacillus aneurinilyticus]
MTTKRDSTRNDNDIRPIITRKNTQKKNTVAAPSRSKNSPLPSAKRTGARSLRCPACEGAKIVGTIRGYRFTYFFLFVFIFFVLPLAGLSLILASSYSTPFLLSPEFIRSMKLFAIFLAALVIPTGLAVGLIGRRKVINTCMKCGHRWKPSEKRK